MGKKGNPLLVDFEGKPKTKSKSGKRKPPTGQLGTRKLVFWKKTNCTPVTSCLTWVCLESPKIVVGHGPFLKGSWRLQVPFSFRVPKGNPNGTHHFCQRPKSWWFPTVSLPPTPKTHVFLVGMFWKPIGFPWYIPIPFFCRGSTNSTNEKKGRVFGVWGKHINFSTWKPDTKKLMSCGVF